MIWRIVISIIALFLSMTLLMAGNAMLGTLLAVRLALEGYETGVAGMVMALFAVGYVLGSVYGVWVIRRVGHIRAFATFGAVATAAILIHPLHISVMGWMALRLVVGFCIAGLMLVTESWISARAAPATRGTLLAVYLVLFYLATASGHFLLATGDPALHHLFSLAAILVTLSLVPLLLTRSPAPEITEDIPLSVGDLLRIQALGICAAFLAGIVTSAFNNVGPMFAVNIDLEVTQIATFMAIPILSAIAFQWPVGYLSDLVPRGLVILGVATAAMIASLAAALFAADSTIVMYFTVAMFVGTTSTLYALGLALTHDTLEHSQIVSASARLLLAFGVGAILGPIGGAWSMSLLGPSGLFHFTAGVLGVLVVVAIVTLRKQPPPPVGEQTHCIGVAPISTSVLPEIDPRNEEFEPTVDETLREESAVGERDHSPADSPRDL